MSNNQNTSALASMQNLSASMKNVTASEQMVQSMQQLSAAFKQFGLMIDSMTKTLKNNLEGFSILLKSTMSVLKTVAIHGRGKKKRAEIGLQFDDMALALGGVTDNLVNQAAELNDSLNSAGGGGAPGGKKGQKGIKGFFGAMKGAMGGLTSMAPQMLAMALVMEPLNAMLSAFTEPLSLLTPIFEMWGSMLSQLLMPLVIALIPVLMELTPAFQALIDGLMPIILMLVPLITALVPVIQFLVGLFNILVNTIRLVTDSIAGFFQTMFEDLASFLNRIMEPVRIVFDAIVEGLKIGLDKIKDFFDGFKINWTEVGSGISNLGTSTWY